MKRTHHTAAKALRAAMNLVRRAVLRPPPRMSVPDWADTFRHLSTQVGAVGGRWQTHRVEVARGPMQSVTELGVKTITVMSCTQIMKTELLLNVIGYVAHLDPSPILLLEPKDEMAQAFSKERIAPMITSSPVLKKLMGDKVTRNAEDTISNKKFPGGFLAMASAGSPTNLAMRAIRVVLMDEIDKYETTKEGDPVTLAEERTSTFRDSAIKIRACSPTWEETSRIYRSWLESDQRLPFVCCPHCNHEQTLDFFRHVHWEKTGEDGTHRPETAAIYCESCGAAWTEAQRLTLMTTKHAIRWKQTRPFVCDCAEDTATERQVPLDERRWEWDEHNRVGYAVCKHCGKRGVSNHHAGFQASKLYSPFTSVVALVTQWLEAKKDPDTKQTFYNTQLGIPFRAEVEKEANHHALAARAEPEWPVLPEGVVALTLGCDVQGGGQANLGRLEYEIVGWGEGEESWSIKAGVIIGDPTQPEPWDALDKVLLAPYRHALGMDLHIMAACVDSGGHNTQDVYRFCRARIGRNVWAIKGASDRSGQWSPVWPPTEREKQAKKFRVGYRPIILGVNAAKEAIRGKLLVEKPGPGYCHFPVGRPDAWYEQLTSENLTVENFVRKWVKKKHAANEALDARVYAYAALVGLFHVRRFNLANAARVLLAWVAPHIAAADPTPAPQAAPRAPEPGNVRRSAFMSEV
jgi:phage terminase large subunit GpA-like protein